MAIESKAKGVLICPGCHKRARSVNAVLCPKCWYAVPETIRSRVWQLWRVARGCEEHRAAVRDAIEAARAKVP